MRYVGCGLLVAVLVSSYLASAEECVSSLEHGDCSSPEKLIQESSAIPNLRAVDTYQHSDQLSKARTPVEVSAGKNATAVFADACVDDLRAKQPLSFADVIAYFTEEDMKPQKITDAEFASAYNINKDPEKIQEVSLMSHRMCDGTVEGKTQTPKQQFEKFKDSIDDTLGRRKNPDDESLQKAFDFSKKYNALRVKLLEAQKKDPLSSEVTETSKKVNQLWASFMGCLSYEESLGNPDTKTSRAVYLEAAKGTFDLKRLLKPDGVKSYIDNAQANSASQLNLGLYQFSPGSGNVNACIGAWNEKYGKNEATSVGALLNAKGEPMKDAKGNVLLKTEARRCNFSRVSESSIWRTKQSKADAFDFLTSGQQSFSAFCGVNKILQNFHVQVNSSVAEKGKSYRTSPENLDAKKKLLAPKDRCVSPYFSTNFTYNHFGPLQNSTGTNFKQLMKCVETVTTTIAP